MTTSLQLLKTNDNFLPTQLYSLKTKPHPQELKIEKRTDECIWQSFMATHRIIHLFRPDFFMIYKFSKSTILYEHNIGLDLGIEGVTTDKIMHYLAPPDLDHILTMDKIMCRMTAERKLQPLDFIYRIYGNIECPNNSLKRIMRTSFLIHSSRTGVPELGFFCIHDVSSMVTSIRPKNYNITFDPEHLYLRDEIHKKLNFLRPRQTDITQRELDVLSCIDRGMKSKEIASHLFISKNTVDTHRQNMLRKWELPNTAALLKRAREEDWI